MDKDRRISEKEIETMFVQFIISLIMRGEEKIFFSVIKKWAGKDSFTTQKFLKIAEDYGLRVIW